MKYIDIAIFVCVSAVVFFYDWHARGIGKAMDFLAWLSFFSAVWFGVKWLYASRGAEAKAHWQGFWSDDE